MMSPIIPAPTDSPGDNTENEPTPANANPVLLVSDSDSISDDENFDHDGYELLSQDPDNFIGIDNELEEDSNFTLEENSASGVHIMNHHALFPTPVTEAATPSVHKLSSEEIKMDADHIETIKSVMKGITLPSSNLPQWASLVPEEEWKAVLFSEMQSQEKCEDSKKRTFFKQPSAKDNWSDFSSETFR